MSIFYANGRKHCAHKIKGDDSGWLKYRYLCTIWRGGKYKEQIQGVLDFDLESHEHQSFLLRSYLRIECSCPSRKTALRRLS